MDPWKHILESIGYVAGEVILSAEKIKQCGKTWKGAANQFEPRLLAYQTSSASRPVIFQEKGLFILPIQNGTYLLTKTNVYQSLTYMAKPLNIPKDSSSLILGLGYSETSNIDNLRYAGVFERPEILGEKITHGPLLNGRHRCSLDFFLSDQKISVKGVQYETDACYESQNKILIIEGKSSNKQIDSFNIRQLYFPFREVLRVASSKKEVVCIFVHNLNGINYIWKYGFSDSQKMDSIRLEGQYAYQLS